MADKLKLSVPGKPEYIKAVRLAVSSAASAAGMSIDDIEDITIAVSEVCTHIFCNDSIEYYQVSCEMNDGKMVISIDDIGNNNDDSADKDDMRQCFCLPVTRFFPEVYDPSICMIMLRALMDDVTIFSCSGGDMMIRMEKNY